MQTLTKGNRKMQYRNLAKYWLHETAQNQLAGIMNHYSHLDVEDLDDFDWIAGQDKPLTAGQRKKLVAAIEAELEADRDRLRDKHIIVD
jgi:hypothetical protein